MPAAEKGSRNTRGGHREQAKPPEEMLSGPMVPGLREPLTLWGSLGVVIVCTVLVETMKESYLWIDGLFIQE